VSWTGNGYSGPITIANGNRTTSALSIDGTADYLNTYAYDSLGRETSVSQQGQSGGDAVAPKLVDMNYNSDGQFTSINTYADLAATENVVCAAYGYDGAGRLTSLSYTAQGNTLAGYTFGYNQYGEITSFVSSQYGTAEDLDYTYDAAGQLTAATNPNGPVEEEAYSYDANGNRTNTGDVTGANNKLVSDGTFDYGSIKGVRTH
jgi:YD repeat-containing protein